MTSRSLAQYWQMINLRKKKRGYRINFIPENELADKHLLLTYGYGSAATLLLDYLTTGVRHSCKVTYIFLALSVIEIFANKLTFQWALLASTLCLESVRRKVLEVFIVPNPPWKSTSAACSIWTAILRTNFPFLLIITGTMVSRSQLFPS